MADSLHMAVSHNNLEMAKYLLQHGADVNKKVRSRPPEDAVAQNALHLAAKCGSAELMELLLRFTDKVNEPSEDGSTTLHCAMLNRVGDDMGVHVAEVLLKQGADLEARNREGETPLFLAVKLEKLELVDFLLLKGANPNTETSKGTTPLHSALMNNNIELISKLLKHGAATSEELLLYAIHVLKEADSLLQIVSLLFDAGVEPIDRNCSKFREPVLFRAIELGNVALVRLLLDRGCPLTLMDCVCNPGNIPSLELVMFASPSGIVRAQIVQLFLERGAQADMLALKYAINSCDEEVTRLLLKHGALANGTDNQGEGEPLFYALQELGPGDARLRILSILLDAGVNPDALNSSGKTALHVAISQYDTELVHLLLERGCSPIAMDRFKNSPLFMAVRANNAKIVHLLLEHGAPADEYLVKNESLIEYSIREQKPALVRLLLHYGAATSVKSCQTENLLYYALCVLQPGEYRLLIVTLLLDAGVDPEACDSESLRPLHKAVMDEDEALVRLLLERGCSPIAPNRYKISPLLMAVRCKNEAVVRLLLKFDLDTKHGSTYNDVLREALYLKNDCITRMIIDTGAIDFNLNNRLGEIPLTTAIDRGSSLTVVKYLIEKGANVNVSDDLGQFPLLLSIRNSNYKLTKYFMENGANLNVRDKKKNNAFHILFKGGDTANSTKFIEIWKNYIIETLFEADVNVNQRNSKKLTPFEYVFLRHKIATRCANEVRLVLKLTAILLACGKHVDLNIIGHIQAKESWFQMFEVYREKLERMKEVKVLERCTYFEILTVKYKQLATLFREEDARSALELGIKENNFDSYADFLLNCFDRKNGQFLFWKKVVFELSKIIGSKLPVEIIQEIIEFLPNEAMRKFL